MVQVHEKFSLRTHCVLHYFSLGTWNFFTFEINVLLLKRILQLLVPWNCNNNWTEQLSLTNTE